MNGDRAVYPIPVVPPGQDKVVMRAALDANGEVTFSVAPAAPVIEMKLSAKARIYKLKTGLGAEKPFTGWWKAMVNYDMDDGHGGGYSWGESPQYFQQWQDAINYSLLCVYPSNLTEATQ